MSLTQRQQAMARLHIARDNQRRAEWALATARALVTEAESAVRAAYSEAVGRSGKVGATHVAGEAA